MWDDTLIIVTADHGEMLGDHGLREKLGYWEQSYAIPCIVRDPSHAGDARHRRRAVHRERRRDADDLRRDRRARAGAVRRLPADAVPRRRARRRGGATPPTGSSTGAATSSATSPASGRGTARSNASNLATLRTDTPRLRPVRQRRLAVLRPRRRPHMAHDHDRPGGRAAARPADADVARPAHRSAARRHAVRGRRHRPLAADAGRLVVTEQPAEIACSSHRLSRSTAAVLHAGMEPGRQAQRRSVHRAVGAVPVRRHRQRRRCSSPPAGCRPAHGLGAASRACSTSRTRSPRMGVRARRLLARLSARPRRRRAARRDRRASCCSATTSSCCRSWRSSSS